MRIPLPTHPVKPVFISYRREDMPDVAGRIRDRLVTAFGAKRVFRDLTSIPAGLDWRQELQRALDECGTMVVVIGPNWAGSGRNRLMDEKDNVRMEVARALARGIYVLPVLVGGAKLPAEADLPEDLRGLRDRNDTKVDGGRDFDHHMQELIVLIGRYGRGTVTTGGPAVAKEPVKPIPVSLASTNSSRWYLLPLLWAVLGVAASVVSVILVRMMSQRGHTIDPANVGQVMASVIPLGLALWGCGALLDRSAETSRDTWSDLLLFQLVAFVIGVVTLRVAPALGMDQAVSAGCAALAVAIGQFIAWYPQLNTLRGIGYVIGLPAFVLLVLTFGARIMPAHTFFGQIASTAVEFAVMGLLFAWAAVPAPRAAEA